MAVQDHSEGTGSNACVTTANCAASIDAHFGSERYITGNVHVPKARKPYTITKQREKWTDEEHQKFLEAVKLYGRGWRQIEEYVGTKTAVQIRSHAQKFFSKVARESNEGAEGSIKPIDIPPPRPKRKPMHPYPRKSVDTSRGTSVAAKADISTSPKLESGEKERQSPVSVFSALGSDTLDDQHGGCHSPASCTTNMLSSGLALTEKENECMTSKSPSQKQESFAFLQIFTTADQENPSLGESNLAAKSNGSTENDTIASSHPNIKLFGTRLVTEDSKETQTSGTESINLLPLKLGQEDLDTNDSGATKTLPSNEIDTQLSLGMSYSDLNVVPCASPLHCMENDRNACTTGADYCASLPWWALNQGVPLLNPVSHNSTSAQTPLRPRAVRIQECEIARDGSSTGSNSGSVSEVENERGLDVADSQTKHSRSEGKSNTLSYTRGFVPYKRCLAERDTTPSVNDVEERKGQRARVCL